MYQRAFGQGFDSPRVHQKDKEAAIGSLLVFLVDSRESPRAPLTVRRGSHSPLKDRKATRAAGHFPSQERANFRQRRNSPQLICLYFPLLREANGDRSILRSRTFPLGFVLRKMQERLPSLLFGIIFQRMNEFLFNSKPHRSRQAFARSSFRS